MKHLFAAVIAVLLFSSCIDLGGDEKKKGGGQPDARMVMFIGVDISGSFIRSRYFNDSMSFLSHYIYLHLKGYGGLEKVHKLFVGSIGGKRPNEPKTFYPIQTFEDKGPRGIRKKLGQIFPKSVSNPFTDYNSFFKQIANTARNKKLILKPITIVLISDGRPDVPGAGRRRDYRKIILKPLERLSRNLTIRLLYTNATVGQNWQTKIPRKKVKIWTQDAKVMWQWKDRMRAGPIHKQKKLFEWIKDNVDFGVRANRVD